MERDAAVQEPRWNRAAIREAVGPEIGRIEAEAERQINAIMRRGVVGFGLPVGGGLLAGLSSGFAPGAIGFGVFAGFIGMAVYWMLGITKLIRFVSDAQRDALTAVADGLGLIYEREPSLAVDLSAFRNTNFTFIHEHTEPRDMISGVRGGLRFQIFEMKYFRRGAKGNPRRGVLKAFADVSLATIVRVELRGRWTSRTLVLRDLGPANALRIVGGGLERVGLVDPKFERIFEVYSSDQTEARAVLTPSFMERLTELEDVFRSDESPAFAVFADGAFMVAIPKYGAADQSSSDEGQSLKEAVEAAKAKISADRLLEEIEAVFSIVDALTDASPPPAEVRG